MNETEDRNDGHSRPGPEPETLKIEGEWKEAVKKAMKKKKPRGGWPRGQASADDVEREDRD